MYRRSRTLPGTGCSRLSGRPRRSAPRSGTTSRRYRRRKIRSTGRKSQGSPTPCRRANWDHPRRRIPSGMARGRGCRIAASRKCRGSRRRCRSRVFWGRSRRFVRRGNSGALCCRNSEVYKSGRIPASALDGIPREGSKQLITLGAGGLVPQSAAHLLAASFSHLHFYPTGCFVSDGSIGWT